MLIKIINIKGKEILFNYERIESIITSNTWATIKMIWHDDYQWEFKQDLFTVSKDEYSRIEVLLPKVG